MPADSWMWMFGGLIAVYALLALTVAKKGWKLMNSMQRRKMEEDLSRYQRERLRDVEHDYRRYRELLHYYRTMNAETRRGRVIGLDGVVVDEGFKADK